MARSIPEKTFEHWLSMYVAHRFPTGGLWWPTIGEDVRVEDLGTVPGKACLLEAKVTEQMGSKHRANIDLDQLRAYVNGRLPVYYVIPEPAWQGPLGQSTWIGPERSADLAYRRSENRWFGHWTYVCRANDLLQHLNPTPSQQHAKLTSPPTRRWYWAEFWKRFANCGDATMPAILLAPNDFGPEVSREAIREDLLSLQRWYRDLRHNQAARERRALVDGMELHAYLPAQDTGVYLKVSAADLRLEPVLRRSRGAVEGGRSPFDVKEASSDTAVAALPFDMLTSM